MKKINLKTNEFKERSSLGGGSSSLIFGSVLIVLTIAALSWLHWEKSNILKEKEEVKVEITQKQNNLNRTDLKEVYNFEKRLNNLKGQMQSNTNPAVSLVKVASATFPETYFSSLEVQSNIASDSYSGQIVVPDFPALARQINAYTEMEEINEFVLSNSGYTEEGVQANISFNLKGDTIENKQD